MKELGYHLVHYQLSTEDYRYPKADQIQKSKDIVTEGLVEAPEKGSVLSLQHDIIPQSVYNLTQFLLDLVHRKDWQGRHLVRQTHSLHESLTCRVPLFFP